jgi:hypothetical protein
MRAPKGIATGFIAHQETGHCPDFLDFDIFTQFLSLEIGGCPSGGHIGEEGKQNPRFLSSTPLADSYR